MDFIKVLIHSFTLTWYFIKYVESCEGNRFGVSDVTLFTSNSDAFAGFSFIATDELYRVDCCGVIKRWRFYAQEGGTIYMTVWRPNGKDNHYIMVGSNLFTVDAGDSINVAVGHHLRVSVEPGDFIGFYAEYSAMIPYGAGSTDGNLIKPMENPRKGNDGSPIDFSGSTVFDGRSYAFSAFGGNNSAPVITNLPDTVYISNVTGSVAGSAIFTAFGDDENRYDVAGLEFVAAFTSEYFVLDPHSGEVIIAQMPKIGEYSLTIEVHDHCGDKTSGVLHVIVTLAFTPVQNDEYTSYGWVIGVVVALLLIVAAVVALCVLNYYGLLRWRWRRTSPKETKPKGVRKESRSSQTQE